MKHCSRCKKIKNESYFYKRKNGKLHPWCKPCHAAYKKEKAKENPRKYLPTFAELVDRLVICQLKEILISEHRTEYSLEINDIVHDIQQIMDENKVVFTSDVVRDIIILSLYNSFIWQNESKARRGEEGSDLRLTHGLNSIRCQAKNKIQEVLGGRKDHKLDNVEAYKQWIPSGYERF